MTGMGQLAPAVVGGRFAVDCGVCATTATTLSPSIASHSQNFGPSSGAFSLRDRRPHAFDVIAGVAGVNRAAALERRYSTALIRPRESASWDSMYQLKGARWSTCSIVTSDSRIKFSNPSF
jgi:hypothetical protein